MSITEQNALHVKCCFRTTFSDSAVIVIAMQRYRYRHQQLPQLFVWSSANTNFLLPTVTRVVRQASRRVTRHASRAHCVHYSRTSSSSSRRLGWFEPPARTEVAGRGGGRSGRTTRRGPITFTFTVMTSRHALLITQCGLLSSSQFIPPPHIAAFIPVFHF